MSLSFVRARQGIESIVAHALLRAASALMPTLGSSGGALISSVRGFQRNASGTFCPDDQSLSGRRGFAQ